MKKFIFISLLLGSFFSSVAMANSPSCNDILSALNAAGASLPVYMKGTEAPATTLNVSDVQITTDQGSACYFNLNHDIAFSIPSSSRYQACVGFDSKTFANQLTLAFRMKVDNDPKYPQMHLLEYYTLAPVWTCRRTADYSGVLHPTPSYDPIFSTSWNPSQK